MKTISIGKRLVGGGQPCFIVAEAGVNHNGNPEIAKKLIDVAADGLADAVKFQKRTVRDILTREALEKPYLSPTALGKTYGEHRDKLELPEKVWQELAAYAKTRGILFFASPWDVKSADFLETLEAPAYKIASADITNLLLIEHVAKKKKPVLMSTGMSNMEDIREAVAVIRRAHEDFVLLQCTSTYPCENQNINLRAMDTLRREFKCLMGYSGHERGLAPSLAAAALGACVIERHFTLDRTMTGPDHAASLEPTGLRLLVRDIRNIEKAMGDGVKRRLKEEEPLRERLAKSIATRRTIAKGSVIRVLDLTVKGPGTGLLAKHLSQLEGMVAQKELPADTLVPAEALQWKKEKSKVAKR